MKWLKVSGAIIAAYMVPVSIVTVVILINGGDIYSAVIYGMAWPVLMVLFVVFYLAAGANAL